LEPDFLFLNYLNCPIRVKDRVKEDRELFNDSFEIERSKLMPAAAPIVVSSYN